MPSYKCSFLFFSLFINWSLIWASQVVLIVKNSCASAGDIGEASSIPKSGKSRRGRHGNPHQYSCLENLMDRGAWIATIHRVAESDTNAHTHVLILLNTLFKTQAPESTLAWPKALHVPSSVTHSRPPVVSLSVALSGILASVLALKGQNAICSTCLTTGTYFHEIGIIGSHYV